MYTANTAREMVKTSRGRRELIRKAEVLRAHKYTDEEIAVDLGLTVQDLKALENGYVFVDSLI